MITEYLITRKGKRTKPFGRWIAKVFRHCVVHPYAIIGNNFRLGHGGFGVVIGNCDIGDNVTIMQGTTLGNKGKKGEFPEIYDNVFIGSNCDIIGPISIGKNSVIGSGSVITKSIPKDCIAYNKKKTIIIKDAKK